MLLSFETTSYKKHCEYLWIIRVLCMNWKYPFPLFQTRAFSNKNITASQPFNPKQYPGSFSVWYGVWRSITTTDSTMDYVERQNSGVTCRALSVTTWRGNQNPEWKDTCFYQPVHIPWRIYLKKTCIDPRDTGQQTLAWLALKRVLNNNFFWCVFEIPVTGIGK